MLMGVRGGCDRWRSPIHAPGGSLTMRRSSHSTSRKIQCTVVLSEREEMHKCQLAEHGYQIHWLAGPLVVFCAFCKSPSSVSCAEQNYRQLLEAPGHARGRPRPTHGTVLRHMAYGVQTHGPVR